eukprot:CAMPEP_0194536744 /NCGR_PEP_ID=MMETSP0253-20130528/75779_1 /TAXON_ID=2966 /ORGANISM="Noctiluca scintillans" /LENGTH=80 /DNA_ID=CAMNT_0039382699 /DNA_START=141 /DNA_END=382 /DNA_ORIENTATION=-
MSESPMRHDRTSLAFALSASLRAETSLSIFSSNILESTALLLGISARELGALANFICALTSVFCSLVDLLDQPSQLLELA